MVSRIENLIEQELSIARDLREKGELYGGAKRLAVVHYALSKGKPRQLARVSFPFEGDEVTELLARARADLTYVDRLLEGDGLVYEEAVLVVTRRIQVALLKAYLEAFGHIVEFDEQASVDRQMDEHFHGKSRTSLLQAVQSVRRNWPLVESHPLLENSH